ncbi:MAG: hypothetical protein ABIQ35_05250 [Verrucomicrobiota bacterium]
MKKILLLCMMAVACVASAKTLIRDGRIDLAGEKLRAGSSYDLTGDWLYQPGYAIGANQSPQSSEVRKQFRPVRVPQLLNRIH